MSLGREITETAEKVLHGIEHVGEQLEQGAEHLASTVATAVGVDPASIRTLDNWANWDHRRIHGMLQHIDTEQIRAKADHWSSVAAEIRDIFQSLQQDLTNAVHGGWQGAGADAAVRAPAALAAWGNALADSAQATGDRMREAADGADRTKNEVGPPSEMDWNGQLSAVMQQLAGPGVAAGGGASGPGSDDAAQGFAGNQASTESARRALGEIYAPAMTSADSQVPAFVPPADPTGGGSGPAPVSSVSGPASYSGGLPSGGPGPHHPVPQPGSDDFGGVDASPVHQRPGGGDPIVDRYAVIGTDPSSATPMPLPDPGPARLSPVNTVPDTPVPENPGFQNSTPGLPGTQSPGNPGGGNYGASPAPGGPGGGAPAPGPNPPRGGGFGAPSPLGGPTTPSTPPSPGAPPVAGRGGAGGGMAAGMVAFGGAGGGKDGKRRRAYGAGLFDDPFTGQQKQDGTEPPDDYLDEFPETAAERTGPIHLDAIRNGFGPQGPDGGAPPVLGGPR